ncbi:MAG TPA: PilN domain-containing protein [Candidatus Saccharimonadales bacterium]|nr:PilN domain-containing protein [Candidatus Saccharimonadales bacterium]
MINLLPHEDKRQIRAARSNTLLLRYNFLILGVALIAAVSIGGVYFYLNNSKVASEATIARNKERASGFNDTANEASTFRANLATAKQIMDREVVYTKVVLKLAKSLPSGTVLQSLSLDASTFGTPTVLIAKTKTANDAIALKDALQKSDIFTDVHFDSLVAQDNGPYFFTANFNVTFKKDAAK